MAFDKRGLKSNAVPIHIDTLTCKRTTSPKRMCFVVRVFPRFYVHTAIASCWMNDTPYNNILVAPVCISMMLNLLFLCNIVRVLFMKLRAPAGPQGGAPSRNILQAFR